MQNQIFANHDIIEIVLDERFYFFAGSIGTSFTFIFYAVICIVAVLFIYKYVPETKNRTLEQISAELNAR